MMMMMMMMVVVARLSLWLSRLSRISRSLWLSRLSLRLSPALSVSLCLCLSVSRSLSVSLGLSLSLWSAIFFPKPNPYKPITFIMYIIMRTSTKSIAHRGTPRNLANTR